ncbi:uncharacterized protein TNCV_447521 [Trichonephila clavipes]|nr:uncharacterized protein TNCV_447521 [Trichonephila clavipes]
MVTIQMVLGATIYAHSIYGASLKALFHLSLDHNSSSAKNGGMLRFSFDSNRDGDRFNICQVIYSQFGLAIHQNDHQARRRFVEWAQNEIAVVPDFHKRILFSDEAHFWLNGYVNKQNCRIWSEANPQVYVETPLHPEKPTVWCVLWAGGIIGPYFFKNDERHNELGFQQDGATCHTARATIDLLKDTLGDRLISRFGPVNWPPRSCGLTPLDYFLWGYVKSLVYADKPQTLDHLEDNVRSVIADIRPQMLEKVIENWTSRLDYIRASRGSPMQEIIFKMGIARDASGVEGRSECRRFGRIYPKVPETGHGMMDHEEDGDVAINLSKNQAPRSADTPNGNAEPEDGEPQMPAVILLVLYD